jgi:hypothetical protein
MRERCVFRSEEPSASAAARMLPALALTWPPPSLAGAALPLVLMGAAALAVPALLAPVPRMPYFGQMLKRRLRPLLLRDVDGHEGRALPCRGW